MSGGSLDYIQHKDVEDLIADESLDESITAAGKQLEEYGELGEAAKDSTETMLRLIQLTRARHKQELEDLDSCLTPALKQVWRMLDFEGSNDVSKDDVRVALAQFNKEQAAL